MRVTVPLVVVPVVVPVVVVVVVVFSLLNRTEGQPGVTMRPVMMVVVGPQAVSVFQRPVHGTERRAKGAMLASRRRFL